MPTRGPAGDAAAMEDAHELTRQWLDRFAAAVESPTDGAIEDFNQAIRINPRHPEAYVNLGLVRLQQGKKTEAQRDFKRSLELKPSLRTFIESRINQISSN